MSGSAWYASAAEGTRHVFVRDMVLAARIGVHAHEERGPQRVRVNVDLAVDDPGATGAGPAVGADELGRVVDYQAVAAMVRRIVASGHVRLVETLAERIAVGCLDNENVKKTRVCVEKLDVFPDAGSAGATVERVRR